MIDGKPVGGKYSFDTSNRKSLPKGHLAPLPPKLTKDDLAYWQQASKWVEAYFPEAPGLLMKQALRFPVTYKTAKRWLEQFLDARLSLFGRYEDAIAQDQPLLYHSGCSPMLLTGLLTPQDILGALYTRKEAPIESVEGITRQILGWREYVRLLYVYESDSMEKSNYLDASRKLKRCWYDGTTGIPPVDDAIKNAFSNGYLHHILRLMVVSKHPATCRCSPSRDFQMVSRVRCRLIDADHGVQHSVDEFVRDWSEDDVETIHVVVELYSEDVRLQARSLVRRLGCPVLQLLGD